jgi:hypothetical protein
LKNKQPPPIAEKPEVEAPSVSVKNVSQGYSTLAMHCSQALGTGDHVFLYRLFLRLDVAIE